MLSGAPAGKVADLCHFHLEAGETLVWGPRFGVGPATLQASL